MRFCFELSYHKLCNDSCCFQETAVSNTFTSCPPRQTQSRGKIKLPGIGTNKRRRGGWKPVTVFSPLCKLQTMDINEPVWSIWAKCCPTPRPSLLEKIIWKYDHHYWTSERITNGICCYSFTNLWKLNGHHDSFILFSHHRMSRLQQMQSQRNVLKYFTFLNGMWNVSIWCVTLCGNPIFTQAIEVQACW